MANFELYVSKVYYTDKPWAVVVGYIKLNFYKMHGYPKLGLIALMFSKYNVYYLFFLQTWHLLIRCLMLPALRVCGSGLWNCESRSIVANQKLNLFAK